jgi:oligopeptide transport system ATP-binding protein
MCPSAACHDHAVDNAFGEIAKQISHRVLVLYLGRAMEAASRDELYANPRHPYTRALISAVPVPDPDMEANKPRIVLTGDLPSPFAPPSGCLFRTRCPKATALCAETVPAEERAGDGHGVFCHHWRE